jgi:hypothetical protein
VAKEPIPTKEYILPIGTYFLSPGKSIIYQVTSGPSCKLYWQRFDDEDLSNDAKSRLTFVTDFNGDLVAITPWKTESAWYEKSPDNWSRNGANYPSYDVEIIGETNLPHSLTLRWIPVVGELEELIEIIGESKFNFRNSPTRPIVDEINSAAILRMKKFVDESLKVA